jgi:geranylgeranyl pyrophosphate synthase
VITTQGTLEQCQNSLKQIIQNILMAMPNNALTASMQHTFIPKSKLLRPTLLTATALSQNPKDSQLLHYAATAVECVHVYSLIHDDLPAMDNDSLRRGQASCHIAFNEATAILAGDALLTMAFDLLASPKLGQPYKQCQLIKILSQASGHQGMALGQVMDLQHMAADTSLSTLEHIYQLKTGCLIQAAINMGACISTPQGEIIPSSLIEFGNAFGLAFQIHDDMLDLQQHSDQTGKPQFSDVLRNKPTYPSIVGPQKTKEIIATLKNRALESLAISPGNTQLLRDITQRTLTLV